MERSKRKLGLSLFIAVIIAVTLLDFSVTYCYRLVQTLFAAAELERRAKIRTSHPIYHHTFRPNQTQRESGKLGDYIVHTNSLGFKDQRQRKILQGSEKRRIVFIGDSFTEGVMLDYEDTFVGVIAKHVGTEKFDILNAGRSSYSPVLYWLKIQDLVNRVNLDIDEVFVFIDSSDAYDEVYTYRKFKDAGYKKPITTGVGEIQQSEIKNANPVEKKVDYIYLLKSLLYEHTTLIYLVANQIHDLLGFKDSRHSITPSFATTEKANWTHDDALSEKFGAEGMSEMFKYMELLAVFLKEKDIQLRVFVYPWAAHIWWEDLATSYTQAWRSFCDRNDARFYNLFPYFVDPDLSRTQKLERINQWFIPGDVHYSKRGNRRLARAVISELGSTPSWINR